MRNIKNSLLKDLLTGCQTKLLIIYKQLIGEGVRLNMNKDKKEKQTSCPKCGRFIEILAEICPYCGAKPKELPSEFKKEK